MLNIIIINIKINKNHNMEQLFFTNPTLVFCGETNEGKTTTINNIIASILGENVNFFVSNESNSTKILTIFSFIEHERNPYYEVTINGEKKETDSKTDLKMLCESYNQKTKESFPIFSENELSYCRLYLPTKYYNELKNLLIVDIIGETIKNMNEYDKQMDLIDLHFPNANYIAVTKELNNNHRWYPTIVITHSDKINYNDDQTKREKHTEFLNNHNHVLYVDNIGETKKINIEDINIDVYNKSNYIDLIVNLYNKYKNTCKIQEYDLNNYEEIMKLHWHKSKDEMLKEIKKFNNKHLYCEFKQNGFCMSQTRTVIHRFNTTLKEAMKRYPRICTGKHSKACEKFLENYIRDNMGEEYLGIDLDQLEKKYNYDKFKELHEYLMRIYCKTIQSCYTQRTSGLRQMK